MSTTTQTTQTTEALKNVTVESLKALLMPYHANYVESYKRKVLHFTNEFSNKVVSSDYQRLVEALVLPNVSAVYKTLFFDRVTGAQLETREFRSVAKNVGIFTINSERLELNAIKNADAMIEGWALKIISKIGDCETLEAVSFAGARFEIRGSRQGRAIRIDQNCIMNYSIYGIPFNQFPALVYLDGKKISAKDYAKAFAK